MTSFFKELFEYNHHFNQKLAEVFIQMPLKTSDKSVKLFNHLLNAHQIWNNRVRPMQTPVGVWQLNPTPDLKNIDKANYEQTLLVLRDFDLSTSIEYTNTKGETFTNIIRDISFHVINHSTHHRAQIAAEFRQTGLEPLITDYVFYKRR